MHRPSSTLLYGNPFFSQLKLRLHCGRDSSNKLCHRNLKSAQARLCFQEIKREAEKCIAMPSSYRTPWGKERWKQRCIQQTQKLGRVCCRCQLSLGFAFYQLKGHAAVMACLLALGRQQDWVPDLVMKEIHNALKWKWLLVILNYGKI